MQDRIQAPVKKVNKVLSLEVEKMDLPSVRISSGVQGISLFSGPPLVAQPLAVRPVDESDRWCTSAHSPYIKDILGVQGWHRSSKKWP